MAAAAFSAQREPPPDQVLLTRVREHIQRSLDRLPDYTCLETIERSSRSKNANRFVVRDVVRIEVAHVGDRELYGLPGLGGFQEAIPRELIGSGFTSTGEFALHLRAVFENLKTEFTPRGEESIDGRPALRYDFHLPEPPGCWIVFMNETSGRAGCHGSFWVDAASLDLLRFENHTDQIPAHVRVAALASSIEYGKFRLGSSDALLPRSAQSVLAEPSGSQSRNTIEFSHCRQYLGESVITYGEPVPESPTAKPNVTGTQLPAGLRLRVRLESELDLETAGAGDLVTARLEADAASFGPLVVPKGALLRGRIRRLEKQASPGKPVLVHLEFTEIEFGGRRMEFYGRLESVHSSPGVRWKRDPGPEVLGAVTLELSAGRRKLPQGLEMVWQTRDPRY